MSPRAHVTLLMVTGCSPQSSVSLLPGNGSSRQLLLDKLSQLTIQTPDLCFKLPNVFWSSIPGVVVIQDGFLIISSAGLIVLFLHSRA